jgi:hypothetical protein
MNNSKLITFGNQHSIEKDSIFKEKSNLEWVYWGNRNKFGDELLEMFNNSGSHNAIIETKSRIILGDGVVQDDELEYSERTQEFIDECNEDGESLTELFKKITIDFEIFGMGYLEVIPRKGGKGYNLYHIDANKIRWGKLNDKNKIDKYYYSRNWDKYRQNDIIEFESLNSKSKDRKILPIIRYTPGVDYYAYPDYLSGYRWIKIDEEISNYHYSALKNGFNPGLFISIPAINTPEEREIIVQSLKEEFQGTDETNKLMLSFFDPLAQNKPEIKQLNVSNIDKQYDLLNKTTLQQILIAHHVTNENLVGISTPGKLGSSNELIEAREIYYNDVLKYDQSTIINSFNKVMKLNGMNDINILNNPSYSVSFSENILKEILTTDELREKIGYEKLEDDEIVKDEESFEKFSSVRTIKADNYEQVLGNANLDDLYTWKMSAGENCPSCKSFNGTTRTLREWLTLAIPGCPTGRNFGDGKDTNFPHSPYGTYCESDCHCKLSKVGRAT